MVAVVLIVLIIITTKKGTYDKLSVSYNGYVGVQNVSKKLDMMNAYEYAKFVKITTTHISIKILTEVLTILTVHVREGYMKFLICWFHI